AAVPRRAGHLDQLDGAPACRNRRGIPGEGDGVPGRDGRAWPVPQAVPRMRIAGATYPLRRKRGELLCHLPDGRPAARGPLPVAAPEAGLATLARGVGGARPLTPGASPGTPLVLLHALRPRQLRLVPVQPRPVVRRARRGAGGV